MIKFADYNELKEVYDKGKHNIFYEKGNVKYEVSHLGSTIYCRNVEKSMGMGAIHNFPIEHFYGEDKPIVETPQIEETNEHND